MGSGARAAALSLAISRSLRWLMLLPHLGSEKRVEFNVSKTQRNRGVVFFCLNRPPRVTYRYTPIGHMRLPDVSYRYVLR
jgi:hypothetical protein